MDIAMIKHLSAFAMMIRDGREITVMNQFAKKVVYMDTVKVHNNACKYMLQGPRHSVYIGTISS
jgi:hypothetical protein